MVKVPEDLKGKELYQFLIEHKGDLIQQKKSIIKTSDVLVHDVPLFKVKEDGVVKAEPGDVVNDDIVRVKIAGNASNWMDSHDDVLLRDSGKKSIVERKHIIPHLHDHVHRMDAKVGEPTNIYYQDVSLAELGINKSGTAQLLIMESNVHKSYNKHVFEQYKSKRVNQHSIGLQYVKIQLAINDKDEAAEYEVWKKHIDQVINREEAEKKGYFWAVSEYKLLEISAVLFGANVLTPTLEAKTNTTDSEPSIDTQEQPVSSNKQLVEILKNFKLF